jgi:hypothetical protein
MDWTGILVHTWVCLLDKTERQWLDRTLQIMLSSGWTRRQCHESTDTYSPRNAIGEWEMGEEEGHDILGPCSSKLPVQRSLTRKSKGWNSMCTWLYRVNCFTEIKFFRIFGTWSKDFIEIFFLKVGKEANPV